MNHSIPKCLPAFICLLFLFNYSIAQQKISGTVVSEGNAPLSGATVNIKNSAISTITGSDGSFSLNAKKGEILEISFIGYKTREVKIANESPIKVSLQLAMTSLDEVVVTGYTSQRVKEITGSVAIVKPKDLVSIPAGQVEQMLQGRVAGLTVVNSGEPGAPTDVRLHGISNFGDVTPLYIIDGMEGNINSINPYDIASVQVLKDAGAYSIYGVRGANGVVLVTTKAGKAGSAKLTYDFYVGYQQPLKYGSDMLDPQGNADLLWIASKNSNFVGPNGNPIDPLYGNGPTPILPDYTFAGPFIGLKEGDPRVDPDRYNIDPSAGEIYQIMPFNKAGTDWFDEIFNPAWSQNHTLTVSGANEKNRYLFSLGYLDQQGTFLNTFLKRFTTRVNTEFNILNVFRIGENVQLSYSRNPRIGNYLGDVLRMDPYVPLYDIFGNPGGYGAAARTKPSPASNPVAGRLLSEDDRDHHWQVLGNAFAEIDFLKNFTLKTSFGGALNYYYAYNYGYGTYALPPDGTYSSFNERSGYSRYWIWTNTLRYSVRVNDDHDIKFLAGTEHRDSYNREIGGSRRGYFTDDPDFRFLSTGNPDGQSNYSVGGTSLLASFFSQLNYGYREKYLFMATLRRDGSSIFGPENRFGWFPSFGVAWRMTEEDFIAGQSWLTDLKLRASWGKTGFYGNTNPFNQYTLYGGGPGSSYYAIDGSSNRIQQGFRMVRVGNANTGWQEDVNANIGFDAILWNGKLTTTVDWYNKRSKGLLFPLTLPAILGDVTPPNVNVGDIKNSGIDLSLGSKGKFSNNWSWDCNVTLSTYNNNIVKLSDLPYFDDWFWGGQPLMRNEIGYPVGSFFGHKIVGIFQSDDEVSKSPLQEAAAPGRFKYADINGIDSITGKPTGKPDGKITPDDRTHLGNPNPDFTLGFNIGLRYKNFDFTTFFYGSFGNDVLNQRRYLTDIFPTGPTNKSQAALYDSWTPDNRETKIPIAEYLPNFSTTGAITSFSMESGSYFRNKSIIIGYTVPEKKLQQFKMQHLRVYVQVTNLFTITSYSGLDPELSGLYGPGADAPGFFPGYGIDFGSFPNNQKQWLVGLSVAF